MTNNVRDEFDLPREVCYLNAAYMTPQPTRVLRAAIYGARQRAESWQVAPDDFFRDVETLRRSFAALVGCSPENISITPSASYGISTAARNIQVGAGERILVLQDQFPSNFYAWQRLAEESGSELCIVSKSENQTWTSAILDHLQSNGKRIRVAALAWHHWTTGETIDLHSIGRALREMRAHFVLDLTQTVGAFPVDISALRPDFMVVAGYKWLFCPYGVSFLYVADQHLKGIPLEENWISRIGSEDFSALSDYEGHYQPGARRFDVGERASFSNIAASVEALDMLDNWGVDTISREIKYTNQKIAKIFSERGFEVTDESDRAPHFQSARLAGYETCKIAGILAKQGVYVSQRGDRLRMAPHLYTDQSDLDRLEYSLRVAMREAS